MKLNKIQYDLLNISLENNSDRVVFHDVFSGDNINVILDVRFRLKPSIDVLEQVLDEIKNHSILNNDMSINYNFKHDLTVGAKTFKTDYFVGFTECDTNDNNQKGCLQILYDSYMKRVLQLSLTIIIEE